MSPERSLWWYVKAPWRLYGPCADLLHRVGYRLVRLPRWLSALLVLFIGAALIYGIGQAVFDIDWMRWAEAKEGKEPLLFGMESLPVKHPSAAFFLGIACSLLLMTVWEVWWPTRERQGFLPMTTTRGDRFFLGLISAAFIHIVFLLEIAPGPFYLAWVISGLWLVLLLWKG